MVLITQTKEEERKIQHIQNWKVSCGGNTCKEQMFQWKAPLCTDI